MTRIRGLIARKSSGRSPLFLRSNLPVQARIDCSLQSNDLPVSGATFPNRDGAARWSSCPRDRTLYTPLLNIKQYGTWSSRIRI